jgi:hypothetical protein
MMASMWNGIEIFNSSNSLLGSFENKSFRMNYNYCAMAMKLDELEFN